MLGHGFCNTRNPPWSAATRSPSAVTTSGVTPKNGSPATPGFMVCAPGRVVSKIEPVSVCHQVSTIGQRLAPMCS
jgi:hypothetical protein